jgi:hypothetical protein
MLAGTRPSCLLAFDQQTIAQNNALAFGSTSAVNRSCCHQKTPMRAHSVGTLRGFFSDCFVVGIRDH